MSKYSILKGTSAKLFISSNLWTLVFQLGSTTHLIRGMTALGVGRCWGVVVSLNYIRRTAGTNHCLLLLTSPTQDTTIFHLVLHFNFCQSLQELPFPLSLPPVVLQLCNRLCLILLWLILVLKNSLGFFCLFSQQEKLAGLHYIFMLLCFPKAQCS